MTDPLGGPTQSPLSLKGSDSHRRPSPHRNLGDLLIRSLARANSGTAWTSSVSVSPSSDKENTYQGRVTRSALLLQKRKATGSKVPTKKEGDVAVSATEDLDAELGAWSAGSGGTLKSPKGEVKVAPTEDLDAELGAWSAGSRPKRRASVKRPLFSDPEEVKDPTYDPSHEAARGRTKKKRRQRRKSKAVTESRLIKVPKSLFSYRIESDEVRGQVFARLAHGLSSGKLPTLREVEELTKAKGLIDGPTFELKGPSSSTIEKALEKARSDHKMRNPMGSSVEERGTYQHRVIAKSPPSGKQRPFDVTIVTPPKPRQDSAVGSLPGASEKSPVRRYVLSAYQEGDVEAENNGDTGPHVYVSLIHGQAFASPGYVGESSTQGLDTRAKQKIQKAVRKLPGACGERVKRAMRKNPKLLTLKLMKVPDGRTKEWESFVILLRLLLGFDDWNSMNYQGELEIEEMCTWLRETCPAEEGEERGLGDTLAELLRAVGHGYGPRFKKKKKSDS